MRYWDWILKFLKTVVTKNIWILIFFPIDVDDTYKKIIAYIIIIIITRIIIIIIITKIIIIIIITKIIIIIIKIIKIIITKIIIIILL